MTAWIRVARGRVGGGMWRCRSLARSETMFEHVAQTQKARALRCFYDTNEQIGRWGKYLAELPATYGEQAAAVVVFISAEYVRGPPDLAMG